MSKLQLATVCKADDARNKLRTLQAGSGHPARSRRHHRPHSRPDRRAALQAAASTAIQASMRLWTASAMAQSLEMVAMPKLCKCGAIVERRCEKCYPRQHDRTTKERGYGSDWRRLSERKRAIDPLCERCADRGSVTPATEVHHVRSIASAPHLRLEISNLMSVCHACHEELEGATG